MELNKRIEELLLLKNGGNRSELARFCNVTPQAVQQWIEGVTAPRGKRLARIAEFLGISEAELVYGDVTELDRHPKTPMPQLSAEAIEIATAYDHLGSIQKAAIRAQLVAFGGLHEPT